MNQADPQSFQQQQDESERRFQAQMTMARTLVGKTAKECRAAGMELPDCDDTAVLSEAYDDTIIFIEHRESPACVLRMSGVLRLNAAGEPVLDGTIETVQDGD